MNEAIIFTDQAAAKVWELIQEEGNFNLKLRVYVTGGGCSGFQYGFTFDETINADDTVITKSLLSEAIHENQKDDAEGETTQLPSVQLLVDALSFQYLTGAEIDYKKDLEGEQFIIRNPNAKTTCGCGSSFSA